MATLPVPEDPTVTLREVPAQRTAVRTFSGFVTEDRVREETALLLKGLADYHKEDPTQFTRSTAPLRAVDTIHVVKKSNAADPKQFHMACLAQCPGVSATVAEAITTAFPSWSEFMAASEIAIATIVQPNGRKVGPAVAKRLWNLFHGA
jgi:hypothetical protein